MAPALLKYDDDLAKAAGRISPLGERGLDELARAYLVLNDKSYLQKIEEKIFAEAQAERAPSRLYRSIIGKPDRLQTRD